MYCIYWPHVGLHIDNYSPLRVTLVSNPIEIDVDMIKPSFTGRDHILLSPDILHLPRHH